MIGESWHLIEVSHLFETLYNVVIYVLTQVKSFQLRSNFEFLLLFRGGLNFLFLLLITFLDLIRRGANII